MQENTGSYTPLPGAGTGERHPGMPTQDEVRTAAAEAGKALKEGYKDVREEALREGRAAMETAQEQVRGYADAQRGLVAENMEAAANAIGASVESLEEQGHGTAASYLRTAADGMQEASRWLHDKSWGEIWEQAEDYARRQPAVAFGGAMTAGFLLARFLKSSPARGVETRSRPMGDRPMTGSSVSTSKGPTADPGLDRTTNISRTTPYESSITGD